jgi:2-polyprenyl-3-methyl-5-hydroxy-6-metoxy-1,4-benzoquinol methylase
MYLSFARMIDLDNQPCPCCGQTQSEFFHSATYPEHHYPGPFTLRRCTTCGLLFNSPRLDETELARLYGKNYYFFLRDDSRELQRIVAMHQRSVRLIEDQIPEKRCIDIGCGRGYFPALLKQLGWNAAGIEISADAAQSAHEKFNLDIFTGTVEQYAASPDAKQFPLVTAIDVIEHVPSPDAFVAAAAKIVASGGWLIIDTPNGFAQNIQSKRTAWKGFNPFHIYLFSIDNLTTLLQRHGLSVVQSFSHGNTPTPPDVRDHLIDAIRKLGLARPAAAAYFAMKKLTISNGSPQPLVAAAASRIKNESPYTSTADNSGPLAASKTGDNIVVIARKVVG